MLTEVELELFGEVLDRRDFLEDLFQTLGQEPIERLPLDAHEVGKREDLVELGETDTFADRDKLVRQKGSLPGKLAAHGRARWTRGRHGKRLLYARRQAPSTAPARIPGRDGRKGTPDRAGVNPGEGGTGSGPAAPPPGSGCSDPGRTGRDRRRANRSRVPDRPRRSPTRPSRRSTGRPGTPRVRSVSAKKPWATPGGMNNPAASQPTIGASRSTRSVGDPSRRSDERDEHLPGQHEPVVPLPPMEVHRAERAGGRTRDVALQGRAVGRKPTIPGRTRRTIPERRVDLEVDER